MYKMKLTGFCLLLVLLFPGQVLALNNLEEAVKYSISNNPEVLMDWEAIQEAGYKQRAVRGGLLPRLDFDSRVGYESVEYRHDSNDYDPAEASLTLRQLIYDGKGTLNEKDRLSLEKLRSYYTFLQTSEDTALEAVRAYVDVLRFRKLLDYANKNYREHLQIYNQVKERVDSGLGRGVDLAQAKGRLALAQSNRLTEANNLHDVSARYLRIVGQLPDKELAPLPQLSGLKLPKDIKTALRTSFQSNPGFNASIVGVAVAKKARDAQKSKYHPKVEFLASYETGDDRNEVHGHSEKGLVELNLNFNLFRGGSDKARISQYNSFLNQSRYLREKTCIDIRQTMTIAYNERDMLAAQLISLKQHEESIAEAREAYRNQFDLGQRTLLDLLDSENEYFRARRAYVISSYDYFLAHARTLAGMGQLLTRLGVQENSLSDFAELNSALGEINSSQICPAEPVPELLYMMQDFEPEPLETKALLPPKDSDMDGVIDSRDNCPDSYSDVTVDKNGCEIKFTLQIEFAYNKAEIQPQYKDQIELAAAFIERYPQSKIMVAGHTDNTGSDRYNMQLSQQRAEALKNHLVEEFKINADRLSVRGFGESRPAADNSTENGRQKNRRVEFISLPMENL